MEAAPVSALPSVSTLVVALILLPIALIRLLALLALIVAVLLLTLLTALTRLTALLFCHDVPPSLCGEAPAASDDWG